MNHPLAQLLDEAEPWRTVIRASGSAEVVRSHVETVLDFSARHLASAHMGAIIEARFQADPDAFTHVLPGAEHGTVAQAGATLTFSGCLSTLDLCAELLVWCGAEIKDQPWYDFGDLTNSTLDKLGVDLPSWAVEWRNQIRGSSERRDLKEYRNAAVHRGIRRSTYVTIGEMHRVLIGYRPDLDPSDDIATVLGEMPDTAYKWWVDFWNGMTGSRNKST